MKSRKYLLSIVFGLMIFASLLIVAGDYNRITSSDNSHINIKQLKYSSQAWNDYDHDTDLDLAICGLDTSHDYDVDRTIIYDINNTFLSTNSVVKDYGIVDVSQCSLAWIDIDNDGWDDLIITGIDTSDEDNLQNHFKIYRNIEGKSFELYQKFQGLRYSSLGIADIDNDNDLDIIACGCSSTDEGYGCSSWNTSVFINNNTKLNYNDTWSSGLTDVWGCSIALGDYSGDGRIDVALSGGTASYRAETTDSNYSITRLYKNNGTGFNRDNISKIEGIYRGSLVWADYDDDLDLDLFVTGRNNSNEIAARVYMNDYSDGLMPGEINPEPKPPLNINLSSTNSCGEMCLSDNESINQENPDGLFLGDETYDTATITVEWSKGSIEGRNNEGMYYNLRIGNNPDNMNSIYTGLPSLSSNPTQGYIGNMMQHRNITFEMNKICVYAQVQTIDQSLKRSNWSDIVSIGFYEVCDGYDNDCDGEIDEGFDKDGDGAYPRGCLNYNNSAINNNGYDCDDNDPRRSPYFQETGEKCTDNIDNNCNGFIDNTIYDDCSETDDANVVINTGGGSSISSNKEEDDKPKETIEEQEPIEIPQLKPKEEKPSPVYQTDSSSEIEKTVEEELLSNSLKYKRNFEIGSGRTKITETIKNLNILQRNIKLQTSIPKSIIKNTDKIKKVTDFEVIEYDPIIGFSSDIPSNDEKHFQYVLPKELNENDIAEIVTNLIEDEEEKEKVRREVKEAIEKTKEVVKINQSVKVDYKKNKTTLTIDIDFNDTHQVTNTSVFQEIPKCLVKIINEQMIEAENKDFEIINADPIIVWHFDNLLDAKKIQYTISAVADENCTNKLQALAVAKNIILVQKSDEIDYMKVIIAISIIPIIIIIMILFGIITTKIEHEDEEINRLTEYIRKHYKHGFDKKAIREKLVNEGHSAHIVEQCLELHTKSKLHFWLHRLEIGFDELVLGVLIILNILDFTEMLPGDADYLKKIISWVILAYLLYKVSITKVLFGERKKLIDVSLIISFFMLTFKNIIAFARVAWQEVDYVLDLYTFMINNNKFFETQLFIASIIIIGIISLWIALRVKIKSPSFLTAMNYPQDKNKSDNKKNNGIIWGVAKAGVVHIVLIGFFVLIFNLMMEWLAIAVDALILVMTLIVMIVLFLKHKRKFSTEKFMEETSSFSEKFYERFIDLFHYKKTIYLGISGMLILHALTEVGNFIIPYFIGVHDAVYFGNFGPGHMPLFSFTGDSLFMLQTAGMGIAKTLTTGFIYLMNIIALTILFILPALVWYNYFKHRNLPIIEIPEFSIAKSTIWRGITSGIFATSIVVFVSRPVFRFTSLMGGENLAGVDILTRQIDPTGLGTIIIMSIIAGVGAGFMSAYKKGSENKLIMPLSYAFFTYYIFLFSKSVISYKLTESVIQLGSNPTIAFYTMLFGLISAMVLYAGGMLINTYIYAPFILKRIMRKIPILRHLLMKHDFHHIHFHAHHDKDKHGNKVDALKDYIIKSLDSGHELFYAIEHLIDHGWNIELIEDAIKETKHSRLYKNEVKNVLHMHHNKERIDELEEWIKKMYDEFSLADIIDSALSEGWTEDDMIIAFKNLKSKMKFREKDKEVVKHMYIVH